MKENETIVKRPGHVVKFEERVKFAARISNSFDKLLVAGLSLPNFTGPWEVILQSINFEELVSEINADAGSGSGGSSSSGGSKDEKEAGNEEWNGNEEGNEDD